MKVDKLCYYCKFCDFVEGYCTKHKKYVHVMDVYCENFKKHPEFITRRPRKAKKYKQINLF